MKRTTSSAVCVIAIVLMIIVTAAFSHRATAVKPRTDFTNYYWFTPSGTYLRQNLVDDEISLTGFDEFAYAPYTLREKGYTPANVSGNPPAPIDPFNVTKRLYSHP